VDGAVVGAAHLHQVSEAHRRAEIGYVLRRSAWGRGYATEATRLLLRLGFGPLGLHKIAATCDPENLASARVLTKVGMIQEGHLRDHLLIRGTWRDRLLFAAVASILE
jgi:ribosomal-protein-alanine N-acetyltransferase